MHPMHTMGEMPFPWQNRTCSHKRINGSNGMHGVHTLQFKIVGIALHRSRNFSNQIITPESRFVFEHLELAVLN